jgi:hypothetical protein
MATERFRRNAIALLQDNDGNDVSDHDLMAALLWNDYKNRMGTSEGIDMQFDLGRIINPVEGLDSLTVPFTKKEMDEVIMSMPVDRAPGPDGYNGLFLKKCWPIIQNEFYRLAEDFHNGTVKLQNINGSYITLVPKKAVAVQVNDFRPISLTNVCMNFLTKLAANRLQGKILSCLHKNQYGFLRNRSIQDCLAWSFEYLYLCQASKRPIIILKLDFAKAFDTIEHEAIIQVMKHKGFNEKWLGWAKEILSTGTSAILLNGIPGKQFECKRGVRQGDPISPLFYLFGSDLLQSAVNDLVLQGVLHRPIETNDLDFPIIQYADNTLLIVPADSAQIMVLKEILVKFSKSTGLKINFHKSQMLPINVSDDLLQVLADDFGCQVGQMPFTYLVLPLGTTRPTIAELSPLVCRLERKLSASSSFLSQGARLQLICSALASMPLHFLCTLQLLPGLTKQNHQTVLMERQIR